MGRTTPKNCPFPSDDLHSHRIHVSLGPPDLAPKRHIDRFSSFSQGKWTWATDAATDRQTDQATPSVAIGRYRCLVRPTCRVRSAVVFLTLDMTTGRRRSTRSPTSPTMSCNVCRIVFGLKPTELYDQNRWNFPWKLHVIPREILHVIFMPRGQNIWQLYGDSTAFRRDSFESMESPRKISHVFSMEFHEGIISGPIMSAGYVRCVSVP